MNYPKYLNAGFPITSSYIESTINQINQRVKGSEKFWSQAGGDALLGLCGDIISDTEPLKSYWTNRAKNHQPQLAA